VAWIDLTAITNSGRDAIEKRMTATNETADVERSLIVVGASARAAAFSALRAGLRPWCIDLFADTDLGCLCPATSIAMVEYPHGLLEMMRSASPGPWIYTGGLENHPRLIERMANERSLWGSGRSVLERLRSPLVLAKLFREAGIAFPAVSMERPNVANSVRWLVKPIAGAGGLGISHWDGEYPSANRRVYYQQYLEGPSFSAVYIGESNSARFIGLTHQIVGDLRLHARPFQYCGSVGPANVDGQSELELQRIGDVISKGTGIQGLFGVDLVWHNGKFMPIEVNPRYTASVEVVEHLSGVPLLALHRRIFDTNAPGPASTAPKTGFIAKFVLFARDAIVFPARGPWLASLDETVSAWSLPEFADIPAPGTRIERGWPVLSFFVTGTTLNEIDRKMERVIDDLERLLYEPVSS
jgi:predicted ATP-grasp superfamily ATP-dependent carboligase